MSVEVDPAAPANVTVESAALKTPLDWVWFQLPPRVKSEGLPALPAPAWDASIVPEPITTTSEATVTFQPLERSMAPLFDRNGRRQDIARQRGRAGPGPRNQNQQQRHRPDAQEPAACYNGLPMNLIQQFISVDPAVCHGKPCFKGTRIMVYLVLEMLEEGASESEILQAYPSLTHEHVKGALHYAARVLEERELHPAFLQ